MKRLQMTAQTSIVGLCLSSCTCSFPETDQSELLPGSLLDTQDIGDKCSLTWAAVVADD